MLNTTFSQNGGLLIGLATKMYKGVIKVGASVPVTMINAAELNTEIGTFTEQDGLFNAGRTTQQAASTAYTTATEAVYVWELDARKVLAVHFGDYWSNDWSQAGFINNTTAIPSKIADRMALILALATFFTKNPSFEAPTLGVTAAAATALRGTALATQEGFAEAVQALKTLGDSWQVAYDALTTTMRALVKNLEGKLGRSDPRWLAFGLQMPSTPSTPGQPVNVAAHQDDNGNTLVTCDAVPVANRYRCRIMVLGVDTRYRLAASSPAPVMTIKDVQPGQTVQIVVQAVNRNLQGVASDPIVFTILLAGTAQPTVEASHSDAATALEEIVVSSNGNGANGHSNGHRSPSRVG